MKNLEDIRNALNELNAMFPRPGIILSMSKPYDIKHEFSDFYPNYDKPGVYVMLNDSQNVLYIGKASCNRNLGNRLGDYFGKGFTKDEGVAKNDFFKEVRFVTTIAVDRAWEAPAVEEFLITKIDPPLNTHGRET